VGAGLPEQAGAPDHLVLAGQLDRHRGRVVAQKLAEMWGQPVLAENRAGAGGSIGTAFVAKAPADGYTLLVDSNAHTVTPSIYAKLPTTWTRTSPISCRSRCSRTSSS